MSTPQQILDKALNGGRSDTRQAGGVVRYHTWPLNTRQDVSQHSWQVARIVMTIWGKYDGDEIPYAVLKSIQFHDCGELRTGDAPYPIKRDNPVLQNEMNRIEHNALEEQEIFLTKLDAKWTWRVKVAHTIEMMELGLDEMVHGSAYGSTIVMQMVLWLERQLTDCNYPIDVIAVRAYLRDKCSRLQALLQNNSHTLSWIHVTADAPPARRQTGGEAPLVPCTPADGGHHAPRDEL